MRKDTLKQAKAAFKTRNSLPLTDLERRQLDRAVELDRRAWRLKQGEKRKDEANRKLQEKEKRDRDEFGKPKMDGRRHYDQFGFKSSQMHLGAFFGNPPSKRHDTQLETPVNKTDNGVNEFFEEQMDDETVLSALSDTTMLGAQQQLIHLASSQQQTESASVSRQQQGRICFQVSKDELLEIPKNGLCQDDLESLWNGLDSSTQIARELDGSEAVVHDRRDEDNASFSSGEFDLSVEDIEESIQQLHATHQIPMEDHRISPGSLPLMAHTCTPPKPPLQSRLPREKIRARSELNPNTAYSAFIPADVGFTLTQLERYVEDDLQLSQTGFS